MQPMDKIVKSAITSALALTITGTMITNTTAVAADQPMEKMLWYCKSWHE